MKERTWLHIAILTLITSLIWVSVSIHSTLRKTTVPPDVEKVIAPLDPTIDFELLNSLSERGQS